MSVTTTPLPSDSPRASLSGLNYRGRHRSPHYQSICTPGALVLEPTGPTPSSVIRQIDVVTVLVRHVGTCDDHPVRIRDLAPFTDAGRGRLGADLSGTR
jgi:hypothetical protein